MVSDADARMRSHHVVRDAVEFAVEGAAGLARRELSLDQLEQQALGLDLGDLHVAVRVPVEEQLQLHRSWQQLEHLRVSNRIWLQPSCCMRPITDKEFWKERDKQEQLDNLYISHTRFCCCSKLKSIWNCISRSRSSYSTIQDSWWLLIMSSLA